MSWNTSSIPDQTGRIAVVTGANSGLGLETAQVLAKKGATVILACRNAAKADDAMREIRQSVPNAKLEFVRLDLASQSSVKEAASELRQRYPVIDLLINNAGVMWLEEGRTEDGFERHLGTNHFGHFTWTLLLLPSMVNVVGSRIVTVSSLAHRSGYLALDDIEQARNYTKHGAYGVSKFANLIFALELERRLRAAHAETLSIACHPGISGTNLANEWSGSGLLARIGVKFFPLISQSAASGALPSLYAATAAGVQGGSYWGPRRYEMFGEPAPAKTRGRAKDLQLAADFWALSEKMTGVCYPG
ncbi:Putative oxidoreductase [gamma proteobacterium HdN1]|nr:Putative oxidoreductase [gamma proteobacterium HdN1]